MSFGCDEFGIHGEELADSADDHSCSNPNHGGWRKKKVNTGVREIGLELREWMRMCRTPGRPEGGGRTAAYAVGVDACHAALCDAKTLTGEEAPV